ncbi:MAG: TetR/AcrR family transcriptional regulator [Pseudomonadota bacterium]
MDQASNIARRRKSALADGNPDYTAKRDELVQVASRLFKQKGFKATTLNDIAKESGIDRATIYYYVASKDELFQEAIGGILNANIAHAERILKEEGPDPREKLEQLLEVLMLSYEENYPHMYVYIQELMHDVARDSSPWAKLMVKQTRRFEKITMLLIAEGVEQRMFRDDVPIRLAVNGLFGMFNWTHRWFDPQGKKSAKEIAQAFSTIFFDGISCRK